MIRCLYNLLLLGYIYRSFIACLPSIRSNRILGLPLYTTYIYNTHNGKTIWLWHDSWASSLHPTYIHNEKTIWMWHNWLCWIMFVTILIFLSKLKCLCVLVLIYSHFSSLGLSPSKFDHRQRIKSEYHMSDVNVCCNTEGEELYIIKKWY